MASLAAWAAGVLVTSLLVLGGSISWPLTRETRFPQVVSAWKAGRSSAHRLPSPGRPASGRRLYLICEGGPVPCNARNRSTGRQLQRLGFPLPPFYLILLSMRQNARTPCGPLGNPGVMENGGASQSAHLISHTLTELAPGVAGPVGFYVFFNHGTKFARALRPLFAIASPPCWLASPWLAGWHAWTHTHTHTLPAGWPLSARARGELLLPPGGPLTPSPRWSQPSPRPVSSCR